MEVNLYKFSSLMKNGIGSKEASAHVVTPENRSGLRGNLQLVYKLLKPCNLSCTVGQCMEARKLLEKLSERDGHGGVVHCTSLFGVCAIWEVCLKLANSFEKMPKRNVVSWTSMLFGLVGVWRIHEAWSLLNAMPEKNIVSWNLMTAGWLGMVIWKQQGWFLSK
nr:pentatricopeptide repeat-containing protein At2g35030, mitochondrial-like [Ziziphus jujuba var. spinosa]